MKLSKPQTEALRSAVKGSATAPTRTVGYLVAQGYATLTGAYTGIRGQCAFTITDAGRDALRAAAQRGNVG